MFQVATKKSYGLRILLALPSSVFLFFLFFMCYFTALPLYLVGTLHAGTDKVGLVITLFLVAAIIIRPFTGQWVGKGSQKKILIYSAIAFLIATMLYPFCN